MIADRERRDPVHRIRDDRASFRKLGHQHPMRPGLRAEARFEFGHGLRMTLERHAERGGSRLAQLIRRAR